jgi:hypothetical protein
LQWHKGKLELGVFGLEFGFGLCSCWVVSDIQISQYPISDWAGKERLLHFKINLCGAIAK